MASSELDSISTHLDNLLVECELSAREYPATEQGGERAEFEAWCKTVGHSTSPDHIDKQRYWYAETSAAWDAWQASCKAKQALESDSEYPATEPSGKRAELIEQLRAFPDEYSSGYADGLALRAADMLEADAQPKSFIRERAQLEQEWCELRKLKQAQMTDEEKKISWIQATIELPSGENCYYRGISDAEKHHGIKS